MKKHSIITLETDSQGRVVLPAELAARYGLVPGAQVRLEEDATGLRLSHSSHSLARVYVEPTNQCNLNCRTCMRHVWEESPGWMSAETFECVLEGVQSFQPHPLVFFGGYGEPLAHPRIAEMVAQAHAAGAEVELITNGMLLSPNMIQSLTQAGLNRLWVSLDGASPKSYTDVRLGAALPEVIANLRRLKELRAWAGGSGPSLGIAFVAMKRNIADLPDLLRLGKSLGADRFSISNVLPHTAELRNEVLYARSFIESDHVPSEWVSLIDLPRMEINNLTGEALIKALKDRHSLSVARQGIGSGEDVCPFVEKASLSVRWDGAVSPCLALLHDHESYLDNHVRKSRAFSVGSLAQNTLVEIWNDPDYLALRERLLRFDFSPCATCNSCEMADSNEEDCFGNITPACGGCLWARGFIQCP